VWASLIAATAALRCPCLVLCARARARARACVVWLECVCGGVSHEGLGRGRQHGVGVGDAPVEDEGGDLPPVPLGDELRDEGPVGPPDEDGGGHAALGEEVEHVAHVLDGLEGIRPPRRVSRRGAHPAQVDGVGRDPPGEEEVHDARLQVRGAAARDVKIPDLRGRRPVRTCPAAM
jgi:hypothetical protein